MACCSMGPRLSSPSASSWRLMSSLLPYLPPRTCPSLPLPLPLPSSVVVRHFCLQLSKGISSTATSPPLCSSLRTPDTEEGEPIDYDDADADSNDDDDDEEEEEQEEDGDEAEEWNSDNNGEDVRSRNRRFPPLSPREKKELRAYAHSLGKKIVSQQIGKAGVTPSLAAAMSDILEANEILKLKVLENCPDELNEVIRKIEDATDAQVVGKIGSVLTLYRPSLRKLSSTQKKKKTTEPVRTGRRR